MYLHFELIGNLGGFGIKTSSLFFITTLLFFGVGYPCKFKSSSELSPDDSFSDHAFDTFIALLTLSEIFKISIKRIFIFVNYYTLPIYL